MRNTTAARGRMPKEYFRGYQLSDWVEFELLDEDRTIAYGKIVDFDKGPDEATAVVSVKAILDPHGEWARHVGRDDFVNVPVSELSRATESFKIRMRGVASTRKETNMRNRRNRRQAGQFGLRGQPGILRRNRPGALSPAAQKMRELQEALDAGKIDSDEFESQMEQLEAQQRHSWVRRAAGRRISNRRVARIEPADVLLLQNAVKQLGKIKDADEGVRMLRDIVDAASEMMKELGG